ncbi:sulfatase-like hydrolase/transferase [Azoarcus indigens]|uniref:Phosphoglycerol transferase MdoB-like AlkP superfamily enzyme n=1 Tax=Azoarcus indigens TaxID=29545 RepID=A0A4R6DUM2_9RHOO|nr:LTA synthase family protein [Azoarcus indigens]NMG64986.1 sulfatase-like hydrolase/transferase [Azoarcus indigens]TDN48881.1 phosphoglycerol transferase MdoB-like AlkP superfamily enzyme [Azoarcus indigens]
MPLNAPQTNDTAAPAPLSPQRRSPLHSHLRFTLQSGLVLLLLFTLLRVALLIYNREQIGHASLPTVMEAFLNGLRFDLRLVAYLLLPLVLATVSLRSMAARRPLRWWLTASASLCLLLGVMELDFYREFHQRLNGLVFQYMAEDPKTVLSMIWYGFPVARYLLGWALLSWLLAQAFAALDYLNPIAAADKPGHNSAPAIRRAAALLLCLFATVVAARGTLRQGSPPLRWGDAYTTDSMFANQLGLNGTLTLIAAAQSRMSEQRDKIFHGSLPPDEAKDITRGLLLTPADTLVDAGTAPVRRDDHPPADTALPEVRNVVVILMESFAGHYVGALGSRDAITPAFDALAKEGLLFTRFFSNGTHTHQGMFATMACFPNLPGFEYLMQTPEGGHKFSGLPQLLSPRGYRDLYVYNGDFAWDNQSGFFSNQGMTTFIGRADYDNPVFSDPTWGVSDQDMFDRAAQELARLPADKPFYALLQTLSNHTPYALPKELPVEKVSGHGSLDEHLTAMRYADWALGRFFEQARRSPYYKHTLFVVVGDHGFGSPEQLTEMDLHRFNVPLLLIAPGLQERFGSTRDTVGTQVDIVPTIAGRLGDTRHQCWGRDLLALPADDPGFGIIKPSGSDQTVAIVRGDHILVQPKGLPVREYAYRLGANPASQRLEGAADEAELKRQLDAYIQTATAALLENTAGVADAR